MTVSSNANKKYESSEERIAEAKKELNMAGNIANEIYQSRMNEPNEAQLIRNFYYSLYHVIKGISIIDTGNEYHSHHALISYFNRESKKSGFLADILDNVSITDEMRSDIDRLFVLRDEYDYREENVEEEDYKEAEAIWERDYPELENVLANVVQCKAK
ncbi:MAG: HEPN domain-containing protein [Lachnospiraceae bacterium]|nr:HEPN domain-containing protein [Lachnospiraceae bacterium]